MTLSALLPLPRQAWETWRRASRPLPPSLYCRDLGLPQHGRLQAIQDLKSRLRKPPAALASAGSAVASSMTVPGVCWQQTLGRAPPAPVASFRFLR